MKVIKVNGIGYNRLRYDIHDLSKSKYTSFYIRHLNLIEINLVLYDINQLPDNLNLIEHLELENNKTLIRLPNNLTINSSIWLRNCTSLRKLPSGLVIYGNLDLKNCTNLTRLPEDLKVFGSLRLTGCINLKHIPNSLYSAQEILISKSMKKSCYNKNLKHNIRYYND